MLEQRSGREQDVQIMVFEDGSDPNWASQNQWLEDIHHVVYRHYDKNIGRAAIRNRLGTQAEGDYLLFLDDDSRISKKDFLQTYLKQARGEGVVCGGRTYPAISPGNQYALHWSYGRFKESRTARQRQQNSTESFHSNNFLIEKSIFTQILFDENLTRYGHEDTLFGYELLRNAVPIRHIGNPVIHSQLETNEEFLAKSLLALENLKLLYLRKDGGFNDSVRLLKVYEKFKKNGMDNLLAALFTLRRKKWKKRLLQSSTPSLRLFDLYKLGYFSKIMQKA